MTAEGLACLRAHRSRAILSTIFYERTEIFFGNQVFEENVQETDVRYTRLKTGRGGANQSEHQHHLRTQLHLEKILPRGWRSAGKPSCSTRSRVFA